MDTVKQEKMISWIAILLLSQIEVLKAIEALEHRA